MPHNQMGNRKTCSYLCSRHMDKQTRMIQQPGPSCPSHKVRCQLSHLVFWRSWLALTAPFATPATRSPAARRSWDSSVFFNQWSEVRWAEHTTTHLSCFLWKLTLFLEMQMLYHHVCRLFISSTQSTQCIRSHHNLLQNHALWEKYIHI